MRHNNRQGLVQKCCCDEAHRKPVLRVHRALLQLFPAIDDALQVPDEVLVEVVGQEPQGPQIERYELQVIQRLSEAGYGNFFEALLVLLAALWAERDPLSSMLFCVQL